MWRRYILCFQKLRIGTIYAGGGLKYLGYEIQVGGFRGIKNMLPILSVGANGEANEISLLTHMLWLFLRQRAVVSGVIKVTVNYASYSVSVSRLV